MLTQGNTKLGETGLVWAFSLPAVYTCPGSTPSCRELCYACQGFYCYANVQESLWRNHRATLADDFADTLLGLLRKHRVLVFRPHVSGDIYDAQYAHKLLQVASRRPGMRVFLYTRSWRVPEIRAVLEDMAELPNVHMWWSIDRDTGSPRHLPPRVRRAYMMTSDNDLPNFDVDLYFRDDRKAVLKKVDGTMMCPAENGVTHTTCERCQICFTEPDPEGPRRTQRVALPLMTATV